jgi:tRNA(fMet)-specific endonuclease VapC
MTFMLDTDISIFIIRKHPKSVIEKLDTLHPSDVKISSVTLAELEYGACKSAYPGKNRIAVRDFVSQFELISFDEKDAEIFGIIRANLEHRGEPIGPYDSWRVAEQRVQFPYENKRLRPLDLQIAAQALARGFTLVTNNTREFRRIDRLNLDNWVAHS